MPTVIDSLILEIGLDPSKFTAGQREAIDSLRKFQDQAKKGGDDIESQGKKLTEFFQGIKRQAIEMIGLFAGATGVKDFIKDITTMNTTLGYSAQRLGVSTKEIAGWEGALQRIGAPTGTATSAFSGLNEAIRSFLITGQMSPGLALFNRIGGIKDAAGNVRDLAEMYKSMAEYAQRTFRTDAERFNFLMKIPGMNEQMATFLLKSRTEMEGMVAASDKALNVTPKLTKEAQSFTDQWKLAQQAIAGSGNALMENVYPALTAIAAKMKEIAEQHPAAGVAMNFAGQIAGSAGGTIGTILAYLGLTRGGAALGGLARGMGRMLLGAASLPFAAGSFYFGSTVAANADEASRNWWEPLAGPGGASPSSLRIKPGAGEASSAMQAVMAALVGVSEIKEVTALNDAFHRHFRSAHNQGRALDLTINDPSQSESVVKKIRAKLAAAGISATVIDEYLHPSAHATGGHIHIGARALAGASHVSSNSNAMTVTAHIAEVNVNAPNAKNPNDASAHGIDASLRRSVTAGGANWNPP